MQNLLYFTLLHSTPLFYTHLYSDSPLSILFSTPLLSTLFYPTPLLSLLFYFILFYPILFNFILFSQTAHEGSRGVQIRTHRSASGHRYIRYVRVHPSPSPLSVLSVSLCAPFIGCAGPSSFPFSFHFTSLFTSLPFTFFSSSHLFSSLLVYSTLLYSF